LVKVQNQLAASTTQSGDAEKSSKIEKIHELLNHTFGNVKTFEPM